MSSDLSSKFHQINFNMREFSGRRVYEFENFRLDAENLLLFRNGEQLGLTPKVVATLLALVERHGEVVNKDELMRVVWPDTQVEEGNLTQNLYILRKTLGNSANGVPFIETLRRRGYRFPAEARLVQENTTRSEAAAPVAVERKANIYSVVDWQRERTEETPPAISAVVPSTIETIIPARQRWLLPAMALGGLIAVGLIIWAAFKAPPSRASLEARNELTFQLLTDGRDVNDATISPNGDYFAYHEADGGVSRMWVQQVGQSARVEVVPASTRTILSKTFSPDGQYIYFVATEKDAAVASLYRVPTLGGIQSKLLDDLGSTIAISPDGHQLAFARSDNDAKRTEIMIADRDGLNPRTLLMGRGTSFIWGGLGWSPDGAQIAFGEVDMSATGKGRCTISSVDPKTAMVRELSSEKWDTCGRMEWTHDGKGLLFIGTRNGEAVTTRRDQLFYLSPETGESKRLTNDGNRLQVSSLGVTRAGAVLVVPFSRASQLWTMDASGNSESANQITNGQADGRAGIAPLPNGRIGYTARSGDSLAIWTVNIDGSDIRQITSEPGQVEELRATGDGSYFYYSSYAGGRPQLLKCKVDDCIPSTAIDDTSFDVDSSISPDGNWIVYNSSVGENDSLARTLRLTPTGGGSFIQLTKQYFFAPHFSPDGRYVSYIGPDETIGVVTAPDGVSVATFRPQQSPVLNIGARWTPDGKALAYIVRQRSVGNIWLQPLDGSEPKPMTNFSSGEIYNFAFSVDGKEIILARGYPSRNALLMLIEP
jgi:Tol biopolymer transport system component/DNA-binding winged helix-turn-helix (wHTH) protein